MSCYTSVHLEPRITDEAVTLIEGLIARLEFAHRYFERFAHFFVSERAIRL